MNYQERRQNRRVRANLPVRVSLGTQVVIHGTVRNVSVKSAFIDLKSSVYLQQNDEMHFEIIISDSDPNQNIKGEARISRIDPDGGIAIYFIEIDEESMAKLNQIIEKGG